MFNFSINYFDYIGLFIKFKITDKKLTKYKRSFLNTFHENFF